MKRSSGILLHITSLPSKYGIGSMGESAYRFVDFLKKAGQSYWQILPLNPPGYGNSPYQAFSTFAGNPHLIDLDRLAEQGLLRPEEPERETWGERADQVDFQHLYTVRMKLLRKAFERFRRQPSAVLSGARRHGWRSMRCSWPSKPAIPTGPGSIGRWISACTGQRPSHTIK